MECKGVADLREHDARGMCEDYDLKQIISFFILIEIWRLLGISVSHSLLPTLQNIWQERSATL
jgi:hypothetical protein